MPKRSDMCSDRLVLIPRVENAFATLTSTAVNGSIEVLFESPDGSTSESLFLISDRVTNDDQAHINHFPFLLEANGGPWMEANSYFMELVEDEHINNRPTDRARVIASRLIDYKVFTEESERSNSHWTEESVERAWLDFSGRRLSDRPFDRYFRHLSDDPRKGPNTINMYMRDVYGFYKHYAKNWDTNFDLSLVARKKKVKILLGSKSGSMTKEVEKISPSAKSPPSAGPPIGFVRDDGEDLRPLTNGERKEVLRVIATDRFDQQDRLIVETALDTGARKQSILTLRVRHINEAMSAFNNDPAKSSFVVRAGPGSGIDTKNSSVLKLVFPKKTIHRIYTYLNSEVYTKRAKKLLRKIENESGLSMSLEDCYAFISRCGECYYMAKNDPRYPIVSNPQKGQYATTLKNRIIRCATPGFPKDFVFHWLRATFAWIEFQETSPLVNSGNWTPTDQITHIQRLLNHKYRETTEDYLKLFKMGEDERVVRQDKFEGYMLEE